MTADDVIRDSLIARIEQLTKQVAELETERDKLKSRSWELRVGVNNLMCLVKGEPRARLAALLDRESDQ